PDEKLFYEIHRAAEVMIQLHQNEATVRPTGNEIYTVRIKTDFREMFKGTVKCFAFQSLIEQDGQCVNFDFWVAAPDTSSEKLYFAEELTQEIIYLSTIKDVGN